jgi:hypothetical protein
VSITEQLIVVLIVVVLSIVTTTMLIASMRASATAEALGVASQAAASAVDIVTRDVRESTSALCTASSLALDSGRVVYVFVPPRIVRNGAPVPGWFESVSWTCEGTSVYVAVTASSRMPGGRTTRVSSAARAAMRVK